eukprot:13374475-Ditylum_brightwellii.AAC.1
MEKAASYTIFPLIDEIICINQQVLHPQQEICAHQKFLSEIKCPFNIGTNDAVNHISYASGKDKHVAKAILSAVLPAGTYPSLHDLAEEKLFINTVTKNHPKQ